MLFGTLANKLVIAGYCVGLCPQTLKAPSRFRSNRGGNQKLNSSCAQG